MKIGHCFQKFIKPKTYACTPIDNRKQEREALHILVGLLPCYNKGKISLFSVPLLTVL